MAEVVAVVVSVAVVAVLVAGRERTLAGVLWALRRVMGGR